MRYTRNVREAKEFSIAMYTRAFRPFSKVDRLAGSTMEALSNGGSATVQ